MISAHRAALVFLATLAATGCRALVVNQYRPEPVTATPTMDVAEIVEQHNRNARLVQSLEASPSVSDRKIGAAQGRMALVRPRDFKLTLNTPRGTMVDVGSNQEDFWIWSAQSEDKVIYVGQYDEAGEMPPELVFQPDWVIEALGLRIIPPEEVRQIITQRGDAPGTIVLVHPRTNARGEKLVKRTVVDRATGRIREHDFYGPDGKALLARALPSEYQSAKLPAGETVLLPNKIRLIVSPPGQEPMALSFVLGVEAVKVNQFDESKRAAIFTVPKYEGYQVVNLNERLNPAARGVSSTYETMPAPPARARVELDQPEPIRADGTSRLPSDPVPLGADLPASAPGGINAVVRARVPQPPGSSDDTPALGVQVGGIGLGTIVER